MGEEDYFISNIKIDTEPLPDLWKRTNSKREPKKPELKDPYIGLFPDGLFPDLKNPDRS